MKSNTITKAIFEVLKLENKPLSAKDIYSRITKLNLYQFKAENPHHVVLTQLRRHCKGLDFPTAHKEKHFLLTAEGLYWINTPDENEINSVDSNSDSISYLKSYHNNVIAELKQTILNQLKSIKPAQFENFGKKLLEVYGFSSLVVTKQSRDGGIDGFGKLKVGISYLNVAFQCKRWASTKVSRIEVDRFRGAAQGDFEQGIIFTTSEFSREALLATTKKGAIPIILIDGSSIVDLMIEKKFGVEIEYLPIYLSALDDILY